MGSLFRSEEMTLAQLFLQTDSAYSCVRELGELGKVQFRDLNPGVSAFQRKFVNEVRRCDEMDRKLRFLHNELEKVGIEIRQPANIAAPEPQQLIDLESKFEVLEAEVKEINSNKETLKRNLLDLIELRYILMQTQSFFQEAEQYTTTLKGQEAVPYSDTEDKGLLEEGRQQTEGVQSHSNFMFVAGVIAQERLATFERVLWRACRGNVFIKQASITDPLEDPTTGALVFKVVFVLFFQGDALRTRVRKICEGFRATLYQCPETQAERQEMSAAVSNRITDLNSVLRTTEDHSVTQLDEIAEEIGVWEQKVTKVKAIYHTMNMFNLDMAQHCLVAECWCPVEDLEEIQIGLVRGTERSGSTVPSILNRMHTKDDPPTFFKTNKFTVGFQSIVDAYGIGTYREVNPALYTVITFPFLFGVMFGDAGHGLIMAAFALALIIFEKKIVGKGGEMFGTFIDGRYIILLMGLFSIYTGMIYNDVFSKSVNIFGSGWNASYTNYSLYGITEDNFTTCCANEVNCIRTIESTETTIFPAEAQFYHSPYVFGLDPVWQISENKLLFTNSYKMKMSICIGILQMLFGVFLGIFNHFYFKNYINIIAEFIPQMLFMICIFGWLCVMILSKWIIFYEDKAQAPSLLITLINMFLKFGQSPHVNESLTGDDLIENEYSVFAPTESAATAQRYFQMFLVFIALICVPWMLLMKPIYMLIQHKRAKKTGYRQSVETGSDSEPIDDTECIVHNDDENEKKKSAGKGGHGSDEEEFEFGEIMVHQAIHTIEYCLGAISNTASYLRLWALSLAHAELSEVLWTMVLRIGIGFGATSIPLGAISLFVLFTVWATLTIGILLIMEGLSAFLHGLRLHWVEFQNKFYLGGGYRFIPFSFEAILSGSEDE